MKPYYSEPGVSLYLGDAREIMLELGTFDCIITDPVWPNATPELRGADAPYELFAAVAEHFPAACTRAVIQLGCDSDPRILAGLPASMPFLRACSLEYVRPHYKGRLLYTHDVAYVFGAWPASRRGAHVLPGKTLQNDAQRRFSAHPCPRQLQHVRWLVHWFAAGPVLDPFAGSGTTLLAAREASLPVVGIEIEERFCDAAARRLEFVQRPLEVSCS